MPNEIGLPSGWSGKLYQSYNRVIDWREAVNADLDQYKDGDGSRVVIIGSGIDSHRDLNVVPGYNLSTANPYVCNDHNGHSTFVAGVISGIGKGFIKGIAPKAEICPVKLFDKNELADIRSLETALCWAKDNFATVVLVDVEIYGTLPAFIRNIIKELEAEGVPVFVYGKKNEKLDFNNYVVDFENNSCWLDNWYKKAENIDVSLAIAVGLAVLVKESAPEISADKLYSKVDDLLFGREKEEKEKAEEAKKKAEEEKKKKAEAEKKKKSEDAKDKGEKETAEAVDKKANDA